MPHPGLPVEPPAASEQVPTAPARLQASQAPAHAVSQQTESTQLPEMQREVLILAHYEQMPVAEIGRVLAIEVGAVKSRLQRARAQLKEMLAAYAPGNADHPIANLILTAENTAKAASAARAHYNPPRKC